MNGPGEALVALGRAVRAIRLEQSRGVDELAEAANIPRDRLAAVETGRLDPSYDLLLALADGLGVTLSVLVSQAEEPQPPDNRPA
jgi:transcriptional regulator with XRE-family HTH domain